MGDRSGVSISKGQFKVAKNERHCGEAATKTNPQTSDRRSGNAILVGARRSGQRAALPVGTFRMGVFQWLTFGLAEPVRPDQTGRGELPHSPLLWSVVSDSPAVTLERRIN